LVYDIPFAGLFEETGKLETDSSVFFVNMLWCWMNGNNKQKNTDN